MLNAVSYFKDLWVAVFPVYVLDDFSSPDQCKFMIYNMDLARGADYKNKSCL